jgi:hypothetical protein
MEDESNSCFYMRKLFLSLIEPILLFHMFLFFSRIALWVVRRKLDAQDRLLSQSHCERYNAIDMAIYESLPPNDNM